MQRAVISSTISSSNFHSFTLSETSNSQAYWADFSLKKGETMSMTFSFERNSQTPSEQITIILSFSLNLWYVISGTAITP